jgi:peptidyl-prolyl cis-trans isomerase SurA
MLRSRLVLGAALAALVSQPVHAQAPAAPAPAQPPAAEAPPAQGETIAAMVNDEIISTYDLRQRLLLLLVQSGVQPTEAQFRQFQREALQRLVDEKLQMQELRRQERERKIPGKLIATDAQVETALGRIAQGSNLTVEQLAAALASSGINIQTLRDKTRADLSWERWIGGRYGQYVRIGAGQVAATVQRINEAASRPSYRVSEIFIDSARVGSQAEAVAGAQQLIEQIQGGAPFPAVARQFSAAATAAAGGDAGWLQENELDPQVLAAVQQMNPGQLSTPIPVAEGVYIVQLRDKRAGASATLVNLKQAAVRLPAEAPAAEVEAARVKLISLRGRITGCADLETKAGAVQGVVAGDLGEAEIGELDSAFRDAAQRLAPNQISEPIRTALGLHLVAVCAKRAGGAAAPSADQVEDRLYQQQLAMASRRYMRDLRNSATIESR